MLEMLCQANPFEPDFSKTAYHARSAGFVIGEVVRRVTGRELPELMHDWIAKPLKLRYMTFGLAPELRHLAPANTRTGPLPFWPLDAFIKHAIGVPMTAAVNASNHEARSEEHTSELQSLMRISYAVFCLKKKNKYI